ncbi:hypothetical protein OF83DRAFT_1088504 [Amylostereum chailletii]|nr:hypothetical protein OF83DRAFT_1088504 [Amylostereum chailletii]
MPAPRKKPTRKISGAPNAALDVQPPPSPPPPPPVPDLSVSSSSKAPKRTQHHPHLKGNVNAAAALDVLKSRRTSEEVKAQAHEASYNKERLAAAITQAQECKAQELAELCDQKRRLDAGYDTQHQPPPVVATKTKAKQKPHLNLQDQVMYEASDTEIQASDQEYVPPVTPKPLSDAEDPEDADNSSPNKHPRKKSQRGDPPLRPLDLQAEGLTMLTPSTNTPLTDNKRKKLAKASSTSKAVFKPTPLHVKLNLAARMNKAATEALAKDPKTLAARASALIVPRPRENAQPSKNPPPPNTGKGRAAKAAISAKAKGKGKAVDVPAPAQMSRARKTAQMNVRLERPRASPIKTETPEVTVKAEPGEVAIVANPLLDSDVEEFPHQISDLSGTPSRALGAKHNITIQKFSFAEDPAAQACHTTEWIPAIMEHVFTTELDIFAPVKIECLKTGNDTVRALLDDIHANLQLTAEDSEVARKLAGDALNVLRSDMAKMAIKLVAAACTEVDEELTAEAYALLMLQPHTSKRPHFLCWDPETAEGIWEADEFIKVALVGFNKVRSKDLDIVERPLIALFSTAAACVEYAWKLHASGDTLAFEKIEQVMKVGAVSRKSSGGHVTWDYTVRWHPVAQGYGHSLQKLAARTTSAEEDAAPVVHMDPQQDHRANVPASDEDEDEYKDEDVSDIAPEHPEVAREPSAQAEDEDMTSEKLEEGGDETTEANGVADDAPVKDSEGAAEDGPGAMVMKTLSSIMQTSFIKSSIEYTSFIVEYAWKLHASGDTLALEKIEQVMKVGAVSRKSSGGRATWDYTVRWRPVAQGYGHSLQKLAASKWTTILGELNRVAGTNSAEDDAAPVVHMDPQQDHRANVPASDEDEDEYEDKEVSDIAPEHPEVAREPSAQAEDEDMTSEKLEEGGDETTEADGVADDAPAKDSEGVAEDGPGAIVM